MFVFVQDIVAYMDSLSKKSYFNTVTGYFRDTNYLNDEMEPYEILIPKAKEENIYNSFIQQLNNEKIKRRLLQKVKTTDFDSFFHREITDLGLYDEWINYRECQLIEFAIKWCEENDIRYTLKGSQWQ